MKNLATLDYWNKSFKNHNILLRDNDPIKLWMLLNLTFDKSKSCIEIGCFPGKYLTVPGGFGTELNGIDFIEEVRTLTSVFSENGYRVGKFICEDFTKNTINNTFDYVMSFGFMEHFDQWEIILDKHIELVSNNGYLILEVPNFKGFFQFLPRFIFDNSDFKRHNLESMNLNKWISILEQNNFEIVTAEYFGGYQLWFDKKIRNKKIQLFRDFFVKCLNKLLKIIYPKKKNHPAFSSYVGIIAKKSYK